MAAKKQAEEEAKVKAAEAAALEEERQELAKAKAAEAAALAKVKAAEAAAFQQCVSELVNSIIEGSSDPALLSRLESISDSTHRGEERWKGRWSSCI